MAYLYTSTPSDSNIDSDFAGAYNSSCINYPCFPDLHLVCVEGLCKCKLGYGPDSQGGCQSDAISVVVTWISRIVITAFVLFICVIILYLIFNRGNSRGRRDSAESLLENEGRDDRACWYDAPPPYVEVVQPPPTYQEAVTNEEKTRQVLVNNAPSEATDAITATSETWLPYAFESPIRGFARTSCDFDSLPGLPSTNPSHFGGDSPANHDDIAIHM